MANLKTKPDIRYAEFTGVWERRKLEELVDRYDNLRVPITASIRISGSTPYYGANGVQDYVEGYTHEGEFILIAEDGANDLKNYPVQYVNGRIWVNNHAHVLQGKKENAKNLYLKYAFSQTNIEPFLVGGGRAKLNAATMMKIELPVPPPSNTELEELSEQVKIGDFFATLDNLITYYQHKYEKTVSIKKAMLKKIFPKEGENTPKIRFAGFTGAWEERKLHEISDKVTERNTSRLYTETLTNSAEFGIIAQRDFFDKNISNDENINNYYIVKNDDFVYNPRISSFAPVGPIRRNKLNRTGIMSPLYYVFRTKGIEPTYLEYFFSGTEWHRFMKLNGDSGARSDRFSIKDSVFTEMPIPYPLQAEQEKIGQFFATLDNLITLHQHELAKLKNMKKALLEKMFV